MINMIIVSLALLILILIISKIREIQSAKIIPKNLFNKSFDFQNNFSIYHVKYKEYPRKPQTTCILHSGN